jgi:hypothetical protein
MHNTGHPPSIKNDAAILAVPETNPPLLSIADMPPNSFDSLMRSLAKEHWTAVAASPKTIITDASTLAHRMLLCPLLPPFQQFRKPFLPTKTNTKKLNDSTNKFLPRNRVH